ncbi:MAG: hypothetical protein U5N58_07215 [Actinomycetota bacterium]|nr:hypothetical protein [Actinomycetota bacterium]
MEHQVCHKEYIKDIEKYGGILNDTLGVPIDQIKDAVTFGVRKVNIYTDIILCMIATIRKMLIEKPQVIDSSPVPWDCRGERASGWQWIE